MYSNDIFLAKKEIIRTVIDNDEIYNKWIKINDSGSVRVSKEFRDEYYKILENNLNPIIENIKGLSADLNGLDYIKYINDKFTKGVGSPNGTDNLKNFSNSIKLLEKGTFNIDKMVELMRIVYYYSPNRNINSEKEKYITTLRWCILKEPERIKYELKISVES